MSQLTTNEMIGRRVEATVGRMRGQITELAATWRGTVLVPFCREHKLTYLTGNGMTVFYDGGKPVDVFDRPELREVASVIDVEITHGDYFGFYVENVTEKDLA